MKINQYNRKERILNNLKLNRKGIFILFLFIELWLAIIEIRWIVVLMTPVILREFVTFLSHIFNNKTTKILCSFYFFTITIHWKIIIFTFLWESKWEMDECKPNRCNRCHYGICVKQWFSYQRKTFEMGRWHLYYVGRNACK